MLKRYDDTPMPERPTYQSTLRKFGLLDDGQTTLGDFV